MNYSLISAILVIALTPGFAAQTGSDAQVSGILQSAPAQQSASPQSPPSSQAPAQPQAAPSAQPTQGASEHQPAEDQQPASDGSGGDYNKAIFQNPIPAGNLEFLRRFDGRASGDVARDSQFHKWMRAVLPDCMFHYGHDMPLLEAMETVLNGSAQPAEIRDGRYFMISGHSGPYLLGRGMLWIDLQDGIVLGAFYFHPTNGEPTPAVNVFSRQVREEFMALSELPPAFAEDLNRWSENSRVPQITPRYFITGSNKKILLEHDEDYCLVPDGDTAPPDCQQMNSDAADVDMDAANYVEQTHHATNATAWMIPGEDQKVFIRVRTSTCGDLLPCRVRLTRERVHVIIHLPPRPHITHAGGSVHVGKH